MRCQHRSLVHWFLCIAVLPLQAKHIMRRSKAIIASDGAFGLLDSAFVDADATMPVYKLYFNLVGKRMCWQRESEGCRSSAAECNLEYCNSEDPACSCLKVGFRNCSHGSRPAAPLQLYVEAMKQPDGDFPDHVYYWRQLRVKYYDNSDWDDQAQDFGKALESHLACTEEPCRCRTESIFGFAWDGSRLVNVDNDDTRRSIGPSPYAAKTGDATLTLRQYNMRLKASKMETETCLSYHDPTTTTYTTTTRTHSRATTVTTTKTTTKTTTTQTSTTTPTTTVSTTTEEQPDEVSTEDAADISTTAEDTSTTSGEDDEQEEDEDEDSSDDQDTVTSTSTTSPAFTSSSAAESNQRGASSSTAPVRATTSRFPSSSSSGTKDSEDGGSETGGEEGREDGEASGEDTGNDETADEDGTKQSRSTSTTLSRTAASTKSSSPVTTTTTSTTSTSTATTTLTLTSVTTTTTTTTTAFCHCFANVSWRKEKPGWGPLSPTGSTRLRRAVVTAAATASSGSCKKFCLQDGKMHAIVRHKGSDDYCTCYTADTNNPLYNMASRFQENESVIGSWSLEAPGVHGYSKLVSPKTASKQIQAHSGCPEDSSDCNPLFSRGCGNKKPLFCPNTHEHSPFVATLPLDVRPTDSFFLTQACSGASDANASICGNAWLIFDLEEKFTVARMRFYNYVTQDAVRKILISSSSSMEDWMPAQVFDISNTATSQDSPSAQKHAFSELIFDVPVSSRFLKMEILENYGGKGVGFYRIAFDGFKYFFTDFTKYAGKACGGYELEDMAGTRGSEQRCRAQCAARLDCAAVEVVHSGPSSGSCIFHSNIWIPTRSLEDERDCFVREGQTVFCESGLPLHDVCCSPECGICGGDKCSYRPGGRSKCCAGAIRVLRHLCANTTDVACRIPRPRRSGVPTLRLTFENETGGPNASEDLRPSKTVKVSGFQPSTTLSRAGGTAADLTGVNTGIEIRNYGQWFTASSTYMCWIRPTFVRDQSWYFIFRSSGYTMHNPEDGSWAVEFQCKEDKARLMIWTRQPAGLGAVATEFKAKSRWASRWTHVAVVMRVGGAFPQLYLNGLPEDVEDSSTPWSELEDIVYNENQYLIIGKAAETDQQFDGYIDHFEVYEEVLSPQFMRKHYNTIEAAKDEGEEAVIVSQLCLPPTDTTGYVIENGSTARNSFDVQARCDDANGYGGTAVVTPCSMTSKRFVLSGCLLKEQCPSVDCLVKS